MVFAVAFWAFGPYFNYSPAGSLDPWIPVGYFLNFDDLVRRNGFLYYVSRIPFILIGLTSYTIFTPHFANFVLHTLYLWLACLGLYCAAAPFGKPAAIIATVAFSFSTYTATSMAWDYPNGAAIAFVLLGLWLALAPPRTIPDAGRWVAVGFLWAIAGTNNLLAMLVILPSCLMVLYLVKFSPVESARRSCLILIGVSLMLFAFAMISKWLFGSFWFLGPQVALIQYTMTTPDYLSNMWGKGYGWIPTAFRDAALLGICVSAVAALATTARDFAMGAIFEMAAAVISLFFLTICVFAFVEFALQGVVLRVYYTSVYLVAPAYLALAAALGLLMRGWSRRACSFGAIISGTILVAIPFAAQPILAFAARYPLSVWLLQATPAILIVTVSFLPAGNFRRSVLALGLLAFIALPSVATTADRKLTWVFRSNEPTFDAAMKVSNILRHGVENGRNVRFWFDLGEPHSSKFLSIASLYLGEWQGLRNLPNWNSREVRANLPENTTLVHLTSDPGKLIAREVQLAAHGISFGPPRQIPIRASSGTEFFLILQDIPVSS